MMSTFKRGGWRWVGSWSCRVTLLVTGLFSMGILSGCTAPRPGPDKQSQGALLGALSGAGTGAITGAHVASATGPGALIGAGFGIIFGGISGAVQDRFEEDLMRVSRDLGREKSRAFAHEVLAQHYERRKDLHPSRDIFPADLFFRPGEVVLRPSALPILEEVAAIHRDRFGWSRFQVYSYVKSKDQSNEYGRYLSERRAEELGNQLARFGIEPRRMRVQGVLIPEPILVDPEDADPFRYGAAIEFAPVDAF